MIPYIFHHIWIGNELMPEIYTTYRLSFMRLHPKATFMFWDDTNLPQLKNHALYNGALSLIYKAEILRDELLYKFGGIYVDCDIECLKSFDPIFEDGDFIAEQMPDSICSAVIGAEQGSLNFRLILDMMPESSRTYDNFLDQVGQGFIQRMRLDLPKIHVYPPSYFFPYLWTEPERKMEKFPDAFAVHHWAGSWLK